MADTNKLDLQIVQEALDSIDTAPHRIAAEGLRIVAMVLQKNHDYGSSVLEPPALAPGLDPLDAIKCRMSDKLARMKTLAALIEAQKTARVAESFEDSLIDFAGYVILYMAHSDPQAMLSFERPSKRGDDDE